MKQTELYLKYAEVIRMCQGTALEDKSWLGVKYEGNVLHKHPAFDSEPELYEFMVAILEDRPVFVGDTLYHKDTHKEYKVGDDGVALHSNVDGISKFSFGTYSTWQPPDPKRRIVLEETERDGSFVPLFYDKTTWRIVEDTGNQPWYNLHLVMNLPFAIKDGKPIFVGDILYFPNGFKHVVSDKDSVSFLNTLSWTPAKEIDYKEEIVKFYTSLVEYKQDLLRQGNNNEAMYVWNKIQGIIELMRTLQIEYKE